MALCLQYDDCLVVPGTLLCNWPTFNLFLHNFIQRTTNRYNHDLWIFSYIHQTHHYLWTCSRIRYHKYLRNFHSSRLWIAVIYLEYLYPIFHTCRNDYLGLYTYQFVFIDVKTSIICDFEQPTSWYYNFQVPWFSSSALAHGLSLLCYKNPPDKYFWHMDSK